MKGRAFLDPIGNLPLDHEGCIVVSRIGRHQSLKFPRAQRRLLVNCTAPGPWLLVGMSVGFIFAKETLVNLDLANCVYSLDVDCLAQPLQQEPADF